MSARGVAALYRDWASGFVLDARDAAQAADVEALGLRAHVTDTIMRDADAAARLAAETLAFAATLGGRRRCGSPLAVTAAIVPVKRLAQGKSRLARPRSAAKAPSSSRSPCWPT